MSVPGTTGEHAFGRACEMEGITLTLHLRSRRLRRDENDRNVWRTVRRTRKVAAARTAIIVCDMWDAHWSRAGRERVDQMAPRMNQVLGAARARGVRVIHAPSDTLEFYRDTPARRRIIAVPPVTPPEPIELPDPPLPIDDSDWGSDTNHGDETPNDVVWTRQHSAIEINQDRDVISENGGEIYSYLARNGVETVVIMGVHTSACVLNRSFGIKQMVRWGVDIALARDLTDAMYNPALPPYVSHADGTRQVVDYIEKFWCPTLSSRDLAGGAT